MVLKIAICFILLIVLVSCNENKRSDEQTGMALSQSDSIRILKNKADTLSKQIKDLNEDLHYWFSETESTGIKDKGITEPEKYITEDLFNNPKLIPYAGVLGGTMRFWKVTLLGDRWAIAYFEDGHVGGRVLLKYTIKKDHTIKWTILDKYLE